MEDFQLEMCEGTPQEQLEAIRAKLRECYVIRAHYQKVVDQLLDMQQDVLRQLGQLPERKECAS